MENSKIYLNLIKDEEDSCGDFIILTRNDCTDLIDSFMCCYNFIDGYDNIKEFLDDNNNNSLYDTRVVEYIQEQEKYYGNYMFATFKDNGLYQQLTEFLKHIGESIDFVQSEFSY